MAIYNDSIIPNEYLAGKLIGAQGPAGPAGAPTNVLVNQATSGNIEVSQTQGNPNPIFVIKQKPPSAWTVMTPQTPGFDIGPVMGGVNQLQYRQDQTYLQLPAAKNPRFIVRLEGVVGLNITSASTNKASEKLLGTLPAGYRPSKDKYIPAILMGTPNKSIAVKINTNGAIFAIVDETDLPASIPNVGYAISIETTFEGK